MISDIVLPITIQNVCIGSAGYVIYLLTTFVLSKILPGYKVLGLPEKQTKIQKIYNFNGFVLYFLIAFLLSVGYYYQKISLLPLVTYFWNLVIAGNAIWAILTTIITVAGRLADPEQNETTKRNKTGFLADFWLGSQLNPSLIGVDLKIWGNRPGMIGTGLMVVAFAEYQVMTHGVMTPQMLGFISFFISYITLYFVREDVMLYAYDVLTECLGFMLLWGVNVFMPFFYTISGWYLADDIKAMSWTYFFVVMLITFGAGIVSKISDYQKLGFRQKGDDYKIWGKPVKVIKTDQRSLLASGMWSLSRHMNYCGETISFLALTSLNGLQYWQPYLFPLFILSLFLGRVNQDDAKCRAKYGKKWDEYCKLVPYKIFPGVY